MRSSASAAARSACGWPGGSGPSPIRPSTWPRGSPRPSWSWSARPWPASSRTSARRRAHCPEGTLITDAGSTKQAIVAALDEGLAPRLPLPGQPSHGRQREDRRQPRAGRPLRRPRDGPHPHAATPGPRTSTCWRNSGRRWARWSFSMAPEEHDRALAITSHLPHLAAAALASTVPEQLLPADRHRHPRHHPVGRRRPEALEADSPAKSRERAGRLGAIWNAKLSALHAALRDGNEAELERFLTTAKKNRDALGS